MTDKDLIKFRETRRLGKGLCYESTWKEVVNWNAIGWLVYLFAISAFWTWVIKQL